MDRTEPKPQLLIKQTIDTTKKFFQKTIRNFKSFFHGSYKNLPSPLAKTIFSNSIKSNYKVQDLDCFYKSFSDQYPPKEQNKGDDNEQCSRSVTTVSDYNNTEDLKEEKKAKSKKSVRKREKERGFVAANVLAQKMKELEMMEVNDMDHVLDIEEVLHYYSRLTCPAYQEMVDKFFMDMYLEYNVLPPPPPLKSRHNSMRKVGSASVHGSTRSLGPIKI